jgi:hypothetical protein
VAHIQRLLGIWSGRLDRPLHIFLHLLVSAGQSGKLSGVIILGLRKTFESPSSMPQHWRVEQLPLFNCFKTVLRISTSLYSLSCTSTEIKPLRRNQQFWKWHRFSHDSQAVLVYGMIPRPAVLASIPILQILQKMPSYFLRKDIQILNGNPLDQVTWDYSKQKSSYRRFCQHVSDSFFSRPAEVRLRDCTAGAVRLALTFLRPFFHRVVQEDFDIAISYLRTYALAISQWPSQTWVNDHPEVYEVVDSMVLALGEELREKYRHQQQEEISRLQVIIDGLQYAIKTQDSRTVNDVEVDFDGDFEIEYESDEPTLVTMDAPNVRKRPSLEMSIAALPRVPILFQTPITPPDSPSRPFFAPTVVLPTSNAIMRNSIPKFVLYSQNGDGPELSEESSLSPPTRSSPPPILSSPSVHRLAKFEASADVSFDTDENKLREHAASHVSTVEQQPSVNQSSTVELEAHYDEDEDESLSGSHSMQWNPPAPSSTLSSRRSSIVSNDTLCETSEFPSKRFSIASYNSDSIFDSIPIEIPSRSASFSDPWSITPGLGVSTVQTPLSKMDPSILPLPPSPSSFAASDSTPPSSLSSPSIPEMPLAADLQSNPSQIFPPKRNGLIGPLPMTQDAELEGDEDNRRSTTVVETASYIVTGFLVGAFITLFLFSTQRRTLIYLT